MNNQPIASRPEVPGYGIPESDEGLLPWSAVVERLQTALNYWIATVDPKGRPHATPVWGVWLEGVLYFDGSPQTRRGRNLATNPAVVVHLESGDQVIILQGEAYELRAAPLDLRQKLAAAYTAKYVGKGYVAEPDNWKSGGLYSVNLRQAFAWTHFPQDATRWRFEST